MSTETRVPESLPDLREDYELNAEQLTQYERNGHICLRQVCSPDEIGVYRQVLSDIVRERNYHDKPIEERDTYGKAFIQITNLWEKDEAARKFVFARRFARIAAQLMNVPRVRLYHDQALFKEPGGGHTPWHQDQIFWPIDSDKTITLWMPLVPVTREVGSMSFVDESHSMGYINRQFISDESHRTLKSYIEAKGLRQTNYGALAAGDATFHAGWTIHSAPGNPTEQMREVMTIIYYADGIQVAKPDNSARENDRKAWFPGCAPGDLAVSPLNPLLYDALED